MKKRFFLSTLLTFSISVASMGQVDTPPFGYHKVWSDEFNGTTLNERNWTIEVNGNGGGNQELQYYRKENVSEADGNLILTARRENFSGKSFTSGRIISKGKAAFKHGIIQARIKMPKTENGLWPAYWMMGNDIDRYGWPRCGEMDIIEMGHKSGIDNGTQTRYFAGTLHWGTDASNENHQFASQDFTAPADNAVENDDYHVFTVIWDNGHIEMYYDLQGWTAAKKRQAKYFSYDVNYEDNAKAAGMYFQKPFFFLFNLAVGGTYPSIYDPALITALPNNGDEAKMFVDWVRVYQSDDDNDALFTYIDADGNKQTNIPEEPEPEHNTDSITVLSGFATQALDEKGVSTFDFNDVEDAVLISTSEGVTGNLLKNNAVKADYNVDNNKNFLYIWENTFVPNGTTDRKNSFGWDEGYNRYAVTNVGWSGLGFSSSAGNGKDLSMIDDSYWLHFAMKADDPVEHTSHTINVGDAKFRIGQSDGTAVSLGDFPRNGQWYYFDIPVKVLHQMASNLFGTTAKSYEGNVVAFLSGGNEGAELDFDNIFFYKSKNKKVPTYTDNTADLGPYGYKSLDEDGNAVFDFSNVQNVTPLVLSQDMWEHVTAGGTYDNSIVSKDNDLTEQAAKNNFFIWGDPQTFTSISILDTSNSFGHKPYGGFKAYASTIGPNWNGMGYASISGQGNNVTAKDLSKIDDSYYVHFSVRSDAAIGHVPVTVKFGAADGDAAISLGRYSNAPLFADFPRDGEWYSFDIPVTVLKNYGKLWSNAPEKGGLTAYTDYALCINTMPVYYSGSSFSVDNVFFYQPIETQPAEPALGYYTTKSLDARGKSTFDFSEKRFWPVTAGAAERNAMGEDNIVADFSINDKDTHLYYWEKTYEAGKAEGTNSFGNEEEWTKAVVTDKGWSGMGIISDKGYDLSQIDDSTYLHFAMKSTGDADYHFTVGQAHFTIGAMGYTNNNKEICPRLGDMKRDGEWYNFDIPVAVLKKMNTNLWNGQQYNFKSNLICIDSGSKEGTEVEIDNIFFWRSKKADTSTSVSNVMKDTATSSAPIGIYNLSGQRVTTIKAPGIYIIKTASETKKIFIK